MAIVHADNFSMYGTSATYPLDGVYASFQSATLTTDPDLLSAGTVVRVAGQNTQGVRFVLPSTTATVGVANRVFMPSLPTQNAEIPTVCQIKDGANTQIASITIDTTGRIVAHSGSRDGAVLGTTDAPAVTSKAWWHIETKFVQDDATGTIEVRVEGVPVLVLDSLNLGSLPVAQIGWGAAPSAATTPTCYWKDLVVWDGTSSQNNDFLGSVSVYSMPTVSDVDSGWTLNGGATGYGILDNNPPVDATEYLSAAYPAPDPSTFGLGTLPDNITSIKCLMTMVRAKKIDGGDGNLQNSLVSGTETVDGADRPITAAFTYWRDFFPVDPNTDAPWLVNAAEAALLKINRTV